MARRRFVARTRIRHQHTPGTMNRLEADFALRCQIDPEWLVNPLQIRVGVFRFEAIRYQLAPRTTITPDFELIDAKTGEIVIVEVKARARDGRVLWEDDARVKIKVLAGMFPERRVVVAIGDCSGAWTFEEIEP